MSEHTPGPWEWEKDDLGIWISAVAYPQPIAKMGTFEHFPQEANARLIAAAPDMLTALQAASDLFTITDNIVDPDARDVMRMVRAVIAKAEGRTP
jgi:hypothetical protein